MCSVGHVEPVPCSAVLRSVWQSPELWGDSKVITSTACNSALTLQSLLVVLYTHLYCSWNNASAPGMLKSLYFYGGEPVPFTLFYPDLLYAGWLLFKPCSVHLVFAVSLRFCSLFSAKPIENLAGFFFVNCKLCWYKWNFRWLFYFFLNLRQTWASYCIRS